MTTISRDEWLKAMTEAGLERPTDPGAITLMEFAEMFQLKRTTARHRLETLVRTGKAIATKKRAIDANGRSILCTAFRLVDG